MFKSFQIVTLFAMVAAAMAFAPATAPQVIQRAASTGLPKAFMIDPSFAMDASIVESLPSQTLGLEVQFGAYLAVLLGTFFPVLFLINLYTQTESRKAGREGGQDSE